MYYRLCWIQNSSTFILGISQIGELWLQKPHYSWMACWNFTAFTLSHSGQYFRQRHHIWILNREPREFIYLIIFLHIFCSCQQLIIYHTGFFQKNSLAFTINFVKLFKVYSHLKKKEHSNQWKHITST